MSANLVANVTITGNLSVGTTLSVISTSTTQGFDIVKNSWFEMFVFPDVAKQVWTSGTAYHSAMVMNDGTVRVCGRNTFGQLGQNHVSNRSTVVPVLNICSQAVAVACGLYHTAILMNDGTVRVCGRNNRGQLGLNHVSNRSTVVSVLGICSQAVAVACGGYHTAILMNDGTVRVCGFNDLGQLGQDHVSNRSTVVSVLGICSQAVAVACGLYHTAILMNDGTVRVCGGGASGQLGQNNTLTRVTVVSVLGICSQAVAVACGGYHTAILMNDGAVRVCGRNTDGQLGQNNLANRSTVVSVLGISSQAVAVACGLVHTAILMNDGTVRVCGRNLEGQLGLNDLANRSTVVSVLGICSQAVAVAGGRYHTAILMNNGTVRVCGRNEFGQLGQNDVVTRSTVVSVINIVPYDISAIWTSGTGYVSAMVMNDGTVRVCGRNTDGQLGLNDLATRSTVVSVLGICSQAVAVACGGYHTAILMNDGTVRVCGRNGSGQLGLNDVVTRSTVVSVLNICSQAVAVAGGRNHTAILMNDGTVRVCGRNSFGQLGLGPFDFSDRLTVVPVPGISSQAVAVAGGRYHTAILMNDGTVRVCGYNNTGQLGQNDVSGRSTVVPVLGICSQAVAVACGTYHTAILMNDGTVRVCGLNNSGELGQNDTSNRSTVVPVLGICSQAVAVACGGFHTAILMNDGTVRVCGRNGSGQLGLGDISTRLMVVPVLGISSQAVAVACGYYHTAILMDNVTARVRVCGRNAGQLGLNDLSTRLTVVPVFGTNKTPQRPQWTPACYTSGESAKPSAIWASGTGYVSAMVMTDGRVRVCGRNASGQLGQNNTLTRVTVVPVLRFCSQAVAVACGLFHTAILMNDGTVRVCGGGASGQLGQNNTLTRVTVVSVLGICSQAVAVACGGYHTAILMNDGAVRVCGRNTDGQLGQNNLANRSTVVSVLGISSQAVAVACGLVHTAILMNDGTVRVCGRSNNGQLGQNNLANRSTVVSVLGICSQAVAVACGGTHTAILMNDGTVRVCGRNNLGMLGLNDVVTRSTVVSVLGICSQAVAVACGGYHTAILMNDGTVRVCGFNGNGQLGQNDLANRSTVVSVLGICSQAVAVACGRYHTAILMNDGAVRVCGRNANGQLGLNDLSTRLTVVSVIGVFIRPQLVMGSLALGVQTPELYQLDLSTDTARKLSTSTWATGSDVRIKSDIQTANLERCSEIIDSLDLKYFEWSPELNVNDRRSLGWIAQDVEEFFPNSVRTASAHGIQDFKNLNSDQIIKAMYGALKNMIQKTYPPTEVVDESNTPV